MCVSIDTLTLSLNKFITSKTYETRSYVLNTLYIQTIRKASFNIPFITNSPIEITCEKLRIHKYLSSNKYWNVTYCHPTPLKSATENSQMAEEVLECHIPFPSATEMCGVSTFSGQMNHNYEISISRCPAYESGRQTCDVRSEYRSHWWRSNLVSNGTKECRNVGELFCDNFLGWCSMFVKKEGFCCFFFWGNRERCFCCVKRWIGLPRI